MPQVYGLTDKGFKAKDFPTIEAELQESLRKSVDPSLRVGADSVAGIITAIVALEARHVWESLSGLYNSLQPDTATGRALDALCSLTGTYRKLATRSRAQALMTLEPKAKVPKDSRVQTMSGKSFRVIAEVVNTANTKADVEAELEAEESGPIIVHVDTRGEIMEPVAGWSGVVFKQTLFIGNHKETDDELRLRRMNQLRAAGTSTVDAIQDRLEKLSGVQAVLLKEGVDKKAHSFEAIVMGGKDQEIADAIWLCRPIGVGTMGNVKCTITDSMGVRREIFFSRPSEIPITLEANLKVKRGFDEDSVLRLKTKIADFAKQHLSLGTEIYPSQFSAAFLSDAKVLDVMTIILLDKKSKKPPSEIKPEQIATLSPSDITITHVVEAAQ